MNSPPLASNRRSSAARRCDVAARPRIRSFWWLAFFRVSLCVVALSPAAGCTSVLSPISAIPASRLPPELRAVPRADLVPIDLARLRRDAPREYLLDTGDVLAIYIEGVLGNPTAVPPVHFPEKGSDVEPALGYPVPVREDGTISLPLVDPLLVRGQTVAQVESRIRDLYLDQKKILRADQGRIMTGLMRRRTYQVIVVREDGSQEQALGGRGGSRVISGSAELGRGFVLDLPAYKNDVLHALAESGGLPGLNARNEVKILRGTAENRDQRDALVRSLHSAHAHDPCVGLPPLPSDPSVTRISLRLPPGETPRFRQRDVILNDGDIVYVESRETEVFYTGGLLPPGQFALPRDYDLDVLGAVAISGKGLGTNQTAGLIGGLGGASPTNLYIIRRTGTGQQVTIAVDLNKAIVSTKERLIIQPGDTLVLRHTPIEESTNFGLAAFFTYGIRQLLTQ